MARRPSLGLLSVLAFVLLAATASVVAPRTDRASVTGVESLSDSEDAAAANYWTSQRMASATPTPTTATTATSTSAAPTSTPEPMSATATGPTVQPVAPINPVQENAVSTTGTPIVGALFSTDGSGLGDHFCSASVVDSPTMDIVLTAAHCIHSGAGGDYRTDIVFVPGYHDGQAPYGIWVPSKLVVDPEWIADSDDDVDFGFLVVHKEGATADTPQIQQVTGGNQLGVNRGFDLAVRVSGYPDDEDEPVTCDNQTSQADTYQAEFDCGGFPSGTSGSPWVTNLDPSTGEGTVVGVIGGYEAGGDSDDVSYSSYFDDDVQQLFNTAVANG